MDKRLLIPGFIVMLFGATLAIYFPYSALSRTAVNLEGVVLHKATSSSTIFVANLHVVNPTNNEMTIEVTEATLMINGTDHHSLMLGDSSYVVQPGGENRIPVMVMNSGAPVGFQEDGTVRKYTLETTVSFTKKMSSLGITAEETETVTSSHNWTYNKEFSG